MSANQIESTNANRATAQWHLFLKTADLRKLIFIGAMKGSLPLVLSDPWRLQSRGSQFKFILVRLNLSLIILRLDLRLKRKLWDFRLGRFRLWLSINAERFGGFVFRGSRLLQLVHRFEQSRLYIFAHSVFHGQLS